MCERTSPLLTSALLIIWHCLLLSWSDASLAFTINSSPLSAQRASPSENAIKVSTASESISVCPPSLHNHTMQSKSQRPQSLSAFVHRLYTMQSQSQRPRSLSAFVHRLYIITQRNHSLNGLGVYKRLSTVSIQSHNAITVSTASESINVCPLSLYNHSLNGLGVDQCLSIVFTSVCSFFSSVELIDHKRI